MAGQSCQNTQDRYNPLHEVYFGPVVSPWVHWSLDVQSGARPSECSQFPTGSHYLVSAGNNNNNKNTLYIYDYIKYFCMTAFKKKMILRQISQL